MQVGKWVSFAGSTVALALMTLISVAIGCAFKSVPDALKTSAPVGSYLGVACLVYFGVKTLRVCPAQHPEYTLSEFYRCVRACVIGIREGAQNGRHH